MQKCQKCIPSLMHLYQVHQDDIMEYHSSFEKYIFEFSQEQNFFQRKIFYITCNINIFIYTSILHKLASKISTIYIYLGRYRHSSLNPLLSFLQSAFEELPTTKFLYCHFELPTTYYFETGPSLEIGHLGAYIKMSRTKP